MKQAKDKGFGTKPEEIDVFEKLVLIHSEISEAVEDYRHREMDKFGGNLADTMQRILHLAGIYGIDLEDRMVQKIRANKERMWEWDKMNTNTRIGEK